MFLVLSILGPTGSEVMPVTYRLAALLDAEARKSSGLRVREPAVAIPLC